MLKVGTGAHMCYVALPVSMCVTFRGISVKGGSNFFWFVLSSSLTATIVGMSIDAHPSSPLIKEMVVDVDRWLLVASECACLIDGVPGGNPDR